MEKLSDALYELAFRYKQTKLWKMLSDDQLFAVQTEKGETLWCCVMGHEGEHNALAVYPGLAALDSWRRLASADGTDAELLFIEDCVQCAFENKDMLDPEELENARDYAGRHGIAFRGANAYPQFVSYKPYMVPWTADREEEKILSCALEAAIFAAGQIQKAGTRAFGFQHSYDEMQTIPLLKKEGTGFKWGMITTPELADFKWPAPKMTDELLTASIRKNKQSGILECAVICLDEPCQVNPGDRAYFPFMLIAVKRSNGLVVPIYPVMDYLNRSGEMLKELAKGLKEAKVYPSSIHVQDNDLRTYRLLEDFCACCGIKLVREKKLPHLTKALNELFRYMSGEGEEPDDEEYDEEGESGMDVQDLLDDDYRRMLDSMIHDLEIMPAQEIARLPKEMRGMLRDFMEIPGLIPEKLKKKIRKAFREKED